MRTFIISISCLLFLSACDKQGNVDPTVEKDCGAAEEWGAALTMRSYTELDGDTRRIFYGALSEPENICSEEHVKPTYVIIPVNKGDRMDDLLFRASAQVPGYTPRTAIMQYDPAINELGAEIEIGLAQAYKDKPGYITMEIQAEFPTKGSFVADSTYLVHRIGVIQARLNYHRHVQ